VVEEIIFKMKLENLYRYHFPAEGRKIVWEIFWSVLKMFPLVSLGIIRKVEVVGFFFFQFHRTVM